MASLVLGIAGRALGGPFGGFVGGLVGGFIDQALFGPGDQTIEGPRLSNLQVTSSAYGKPIPILYGRHRMGGNVVWSPGLVEHRNEDTQGGKGGPSVTTVTFTYTASFRINFCEGPAAAILRVWADGKLVADRRGTDPILDIFTTKSGPGVQGVREFLGTETREPGPTEQAGKGIANTPAYRGQVGIEFSNMPLADFGNRIPQITAEITTVADDIFPADVITGLSTINMNAAVWLPGRTAFLAGQRGGTYQKFNVLSQTLELEAALASYGTFDDARFPAVDAAGNFYQTKEQGGNGIILKYSSETFALLGSSTIGSGFPAATNLIAMGLPGLERIVVEEPSGGGRVAIIEAATLDTVAVYKMSDQLFGSPIGESPPLSLNLSSGDMQIDGEGFAWIMVQNLGDIYLIKIDPVSGFPIDFFFISGESAPAQYGLAYEATTNSLIIGKIAVSGAGSLIRWDIDTESVAARIDNLTLAAASRNISAFRAGPSDDGRMWLQNQTTGFTEYDVINMAVNRSFTNNQFDGIIESENGLYDAVYHAVIRRNTTTPEVQWLYLDRATGGRVTLRSIVEDISTRVGLTPNVDIDASELIDLLIGYIVDRRMPARRALEPLAAVWFFRAVESDFKVKFPKRGKAVSFAIAEAELAAQPEPGGEIVKIEERRIQELELPEAIDLTYADEAIDYQAMTQRARRIREAVNTRGRVTVNYPGVLTNDEGAQAVERMLFLSWIGRCGYHFAVDWRHVRLDPADVGTVTADGVTFTVELENTDYGDDRVIEMRARSEDAAVHTSLAVGGDALGFEDQTIVVSAPSALYLLDMPLLRDADEGLIVYVASGAFSDLSWPGAQVFKSTDNFDFSTPFSFVASSRNAAHGLTESVLADHDSRTWDRTNTVTVNLFRGALASTTERAVLDGANPILIGDEVIQFAGATLNADGSYTLSTLLRGRRGTDWATRGHGTGERVVILSASTLVREDLPDAELNAQRWYKAVTLGGRPDLATAKALIFKGRSLMPLAPVDVRGSRAGSPLDTTITWQRRTRLGGAWKAGVDVPLGEESEAYEVDVLDTSGSPEAVVRTITAAASAGGSVVTPASLQALYTGADQVSDFGAEQATITVRVYQVSATVGRGFAGRATLGPDGTTNWLAEAA